MNEKMWPQCKCPNVQSPMKWSDFLTLRQKRRHQLKWRVQVGGESAAAQQKAYLRSPSEALVRLRVEPIIQMLLKTASALRMWFRWGACDKALQNKRPSKKPMKCTDSPSLRWRTWGVSCPSSCAWSARWPSSSSPGLPTCSGPGSHLPLRSVGGTVGSGQVQFCMHSSNAQWNASTHHTWHAE